MRETGIGTSLILIAIGAILAFAIHVNSTAVDLPSIGIILMVVGFIGLLLSFLVLGGWGSTNRSVDYVDTTPAPREQVETTDVVTSDVPPAAGTRRVERVRRVRDL